MFQNTEVFIWKLKTNPVFHAKVATIAFINSHSFQILLEPYKYICQIPGKQIRTKLSTVSTKHCFSIRSKCAKIDLD